uniref:Uncharacterized protein n=1 Tax=Meloidogyne incognita TaxID=6306 RepID=A0A914LUJ2_MELIC
MFTWRAKPISIGFSYQSCGRRQKVCHASSQLSQRSLFTPLQCWHKLNSVARFLSFSSSSGSASSSSLDSSIAKADNFFRLAAPNAIDARWRAAIRLARPSLYI